MRKLCLILPAVIGILLAGCSTPERTAPIVDHAIGGKKAVEQSKSAMAKPADAHGFYTVKKGDTLFHIALDFGQNYRDLVAWNNLSSANDIKVGQVLRVLPPEVETGGAYAQTSSIPVTSGIEVRSISAPQPQTQPAQSIAAPNKIGPLGNKIPYSETALQELQKPDAPNYTVGYAAASAVGQSASPVVKAPDTSSPANGEDQNIVWIWPADGKVVGTFDDGKKGIDIAGKLGQPVFAASSGKVMYAGSGIRGYGNLVIIKHTNNLLSAYAYNRAILVKEGQTVNKGDKIAEMGNSDTDSVKLHFEIRQQGKPVDPTKFLPAR